jgi:putative DNA primase/helicase
VAQDEDPLRRIAEAVESAEILELKPSGDFDPPELSGGGASEASEPHGAEILAECAKLDHSDADNGLRLRRYHGQDLAVVAQDEMPTGTWAGWEGKYWDIAGGAARARITAQKLGERIVQEAEYLTATSVETRTIEEAEAAKLALAKLEKRSGRRANWDNDERARARRLETLIEDGKAARAALNARKVARRKFGISSKNRGASKRRSTSPAHSCGARPTASTRIAIKSPR